MATIKPLNRKDFVFDERYTYSYAVGGKTPEKLGQTFPNLFTTHFTLTPLFKSLAISHLQWSLHLSRLLIERTYLLHELADRHVQQNHFVQCLSYAQRAINEARHCNSKIWEFLSSMLMAKSHALLLNHPH